MLTAMYAVGRKSALYAECHYAECLYAECCYAECRGADFSSLFMFLTMGKLQLTEQNLGRVFNFRSGNVQASSLTLLLSKTAQLKVENFIIALVKVKKLF